MATSDYSSPLPRKVSEFLLSSVNRPERKSGKNNQNMDANCAKLNFLGQRGMVCLWKKIILHLFGDWQLENIWKLAPKNGFVLQEQPPTCEGACVFMVWANSAWWTLRGWLSTLIMWKRPRCIPSNHGRAYIYLLVFIIHLKLESLPSSDSKHGLKI